MAGPMPGLLTLMEELYGRINKERLFGGGVLGAATRGLLGADAPPDATPAEMEAYRNFGNASMALAAGPVAATRAIKGVKSAKTLADAPQTQALETARQNAVRMLNLPESNTAMDRARAMGFDTEAFHGTNRQFEGFSNEMLGAKTGAKSAQKAHFSASSPHLASTYVNTEHVNPLPWKSGPPVYEQLIKNKQAWKEFSEAASDAEKFAVLERYGMNYGSGQVLPLLLRMENPRVRDYKGSQYRDTTYNEELKAAKKAKKDSVVFKNTFDPGPHEGSNVMSNVYAVFDPSRIRSRFAAFDPARIDEKDLLASLAAMGITLPLTMGLLSEQPD